MKLWLLKRLGKVRWDEMAGIVVRAENEANARSEASHHAGDEGWGVWLNPAYVTCERLTEEGDAGFILRDFRSAG